MTKEKAIQSILILIKEDPALDENHPTVEAVKIMLDEVRVNILLEGFSFNRTMQKVADSISNTLANNSVLVFLDSKGNHIQKNRFPLYAGQTLRGLLDLSFEQIPTLCQYWIVKRVARLRVEQTLMDSTLRNLLWQAEEEARLKFLRKEYRNLALNYSIID